MILGHHPLDGEALHILEFALLVAQEGLTLGHSGALMSIIKPHHQLAFLYFTLFGRRQANDATGYLGGHGNRLVGLQGSGQQQGIADLPLLHQRRLHHGAFLFLLLNLILTMPMRKSPIAQNRDQSQKPTPPP